MGRKGQTSNPYYAVEALLSKRGQTSNFKNRSDLMGRKGQTSNPYYAVETLL
jgi:ABC-type sulfate transport system substrate-binding protein